MMTSQSARVEWWVIIGTAALSVILNEQAAAQEVSVPTNLQVYESLVATLAGSLVDSLTLEEPNTIDIAIAPPDIRWFVLEPVMRIFRSKHWTVVFGDSARYGAEFGALRMRVEYANLRRTGFLGSRVMDRSVTLSARTLVVDRYDGHVVATMDRTVAKNDTVALSQLEMIEHPGVPATHSKVPEEDFFSGLAEPLIVISAIAVAVYLLFTVRS